MSINYGREERSAQEFYDITHNLQQVGFKAMMSSMVMPLVGLISHMTYLLLTLGAWPSCKGADYREPASLRPICHSRSTDSDDHPATGAAVS